MKGLLLKDIYTLLKQFKIFLIMIVAFSVWPGSFMSGFAICYASMLPVTALAYDERSKWDKYAAMLPCSPYDIAASKYLLGFISVSGALLLSAVGTTISGFVSEKPVSSSDLFGLVILGCAALVFQAINLPLMFKFGVEKGRLFFIAAAVFISVLSVTASEGIGGLLDSRYIFTVPVVIAVIIATVLLNVLSVWLSAGLYKKRIA